jgi:hypothetical protein
LEHHNDEKLLEAKDKKKSQKDEKSKEWDSDDYF